jgi:peptide/nickel transport system substrate-binding protein
LTFLLIIMGSIISIPIISYYHFTIPVAAYGGSIEEGIIGAPRHINPLLSQSDADRDLVRLIYSGLLKYNENGKLVPDLVKSYEISPDELNYTVYLKDGIKWHDNIPLTSSDVVFTIQIAQNNDYGSLQRINWQGIEIEKIDDRTLVFKLKNKYAQFLNNLTLPILPEHLWANVKPINFSLSELNIKPIGSGPYKFKKLQKDTLGRIRLYELGANNEFYGGKPFVKEILIKFFGSEDELINSYNKGEVDSLGLISPSNIQKIKFKQRLDIKKISMPRYFGVFFNQNQSEILSDKNVRLALAYGTDKKALIENILYGNGIDIHSPILPALTDVNKDVKKYEYDTGLASETLDKAGWNSKNESGILQKNEAKLSIKLTTSTWPELISAANILKDQWKEVGIDLQIEALPTPDLQQVIKNRNYQMLLFGEIINLDPDPFSLWHSSQKRDPGLNLALYDNKTADTLLEEARKTLDPIERAQKYDDFQKLVIEELPTLFLYSPYYLYGLSVKVNGFENKIISTPSDRFLNIEKWYVETKRVWK